VDAELAAFGFVCGGGGDGISVVVRAGEVMKN
jgi:hypothetical protein